MDITSVATALSTLKTATDLAQVIRTSDMTLDKAETKMKLADLMGALAEVRIQLADVQETLIARAQEITELKAKLRLRGAMKYEAPFYWEYLDGGVKDGPFCQRCFEKDGIQIRTQDLKNGYHSCLNCTNTYDVGGRSRRVRESEDF